MLNKYDDRENSRAVLSTKNHYDFIKCCELCNLGLCTQEVRIKDRADVRRSRPRVPRFQYTDICDPFFKNIRFLQTFFQTQCELKFTSPYNHKKKQES